MISFGDGAFDAMVRTIAGYEGYRVRLSRHVKGEHGPWMPMDVESVKATDDGLSVCLVDNDGGEGALGDPFEVPWTEVFAIVVD